MANKQQIKRGRPPLYPWHKWLRKGKITSLEKGKDFECETQSMVLMARRHLRNKKLEATVKVRHTTVIIEVK